RTVKESVVPGTTDRRALTCAPEPPAFPPPMLLADAPPCPPSPLTTTKQIPVGTVTTAGPTPGVVDENRVVGTAPADPVIPHRPNANALAAPPTRPVTRDHRMPHLRLDQTAAGRYTSGESRRGSQHAGAMTPRPAHRNSSAHMISMVYPCHEIARPNSTRSLTDSRSDGSRVNTVPTDTHVTWRRQG